MVEQIERTPAEKDAVIAALLGDFKPDDSLGYNATIQKSLLIARRLQQRAAELQTPEERKQQMELDRMIQNPGDKATLTQLTDQAFRSDEASRAADQLIHILDMQGVPRFFSPVERTLLKGFQSFGSYLPGVAVPLVKDQMRRETANVILPAEDEILRDHLNARRSESVRMNVNYLGEAILGEEEAHNRLTQYLQALQLPEIEVVSVKISTVYSQISPISREHTIQQICDRMELLYRAAAKGEFKRADGSIVPKFVYLDMEEYRDMSLTTDVFMRTLDRPGMENILAGIVFQAYVPDSHLAQQKVTEWAKQRVASGGAPVTMRIVKGANMEMERVEASLHGWPQAPFQQKVDTDANYKRMVQYALDPDNRVAVRPGIASHNLFDISYALVLACENEALSDLQFEMLEGMANHQRRALHELVRSLLLYAPACHKKDFISAIGYLVRRLDENTGPENFLRHAFNITVDSPAWTQLEQGFLASFDRLKTLSNAPRRTQDRNTETFEFDHNLPTLDEFTNEPDTDFSLIANSKWADKIVADIQNELEGEALRQVPLFVAGTEITDERKTRRCNDPSNKFGDIAEYKQANADDIQAAVECAQQDPSGWRTKTINERHNLLRKTANELRIARGKLMAWAMAEGGKTLLESDPEVSEAIDFCEFYSASAAAIESLGGIKASPRGVVVVVSPWNFPIAIPCGGVAAALAAGNTVILKPASNSVAIAHEMIECFYAAGVPRTALQLIPCSGGTEGQQLVSHDAVDTVILTGGTDTALRMLDNKPALRLLAETGGKNATIVTALADRDQAIKHVIHSAFGHCGQKCSATSLLLLEDEVFEDEDFKRALVDAVSSLKIGHAWDTNSKLGPLSSPPAGDLEQGLKVLEKGEEWALMPRRSPLGPNIYSPGIKWNVKRGSYTHLTEFFGPVLGVMKFRRLGEAIDIVNETGYGLTSGLESLDDREQEQWLAGIRAGNLYINRSTTGAIVLRQPFGGMGKSAFGPGIKAGGPNYVAQFLNFEETPTPTADAHIDAEPLRELAALVKSDEFIGLSSDQESERIHRALSSYDFNARDEFLVEHDHFRLVGQDNIRRYLPIRSLCVRIHADDTWFDIIGRVAAARAVGSRPIISSPPGTHTEWLTFLHDQTESWAADIEFVVQTDEDLVESIKYQEVSRLRYAAADRVPDLIRQAVIGHYIHIADAPVIAEGRIELLWNVMEQSLSIDYHRYGNLGERASEERATIT